MKNIIILIIINFVYGQDFTVDGNLRVEGNVIYSDNSSQSTASFSGINGVAEYENSATWTVPAGIHKILVQMIGAGGGGSANGLYQGPPCGTNGQGGNGGGYVHAVVNVTPGETLTINIGAGGQAATVANSYGDPGGNTNIINEAGSVLAVAEGGGNGSSGSINDGVGYIRNGYGSSHEGGLPNAVDFGFDYGKGGNGTTCSGNTVNNPNEDGNSGYLLLYW